MEKQPTSGCGSVYDHLSELDRRILELNHSGLTAGKISKALEEMYGIELTKSSVNRHLTEMRLDLSNEVRVNFTVKNRRPKSENKWYKIVLKLKNAIPEYTRLTGFKPSSRTMFYQFVDEGIIRKEEHASFVNATVKARLGYTDSNGELIFPKLDMDCFAEDDSRIALYDYDATKPQAPIPPGDPPDPDEYVEAIIANTKQAPDIFTGLGKWGIDGKIGGRWYNQPEYVEVWDEKNDLIPGFSKILESRKVNIRGNKGFTSLNFLNRCIEELKEFIERTGIGPKHIHIKYCGDCDPSGLAIDYYIKRRLRQLGIPEVDFKRIAVTHEQIDKYKFPLLPIEQVDENKKDDPNVAEYKRLYGDKATHLNAFFTRKHLPAFKKLLLAEVDRHWSKSIYDNMVKEYDVEAEPPEQYTEERLREIREEMRERIRDAFRDY